MKTAKKLVSILLAVMMIVVTAVSASAQSADLTGHVYDAYRIFSGTQISGDRGLGSATWGTGINAAAFLTAIKGDSTFNVGENGANIFANVGEVNDARCAENVAEALSKYENKSAVANQFAKLAYDHKATAAYTGIVPSTAELDPGYYLLVDSTSLSGNNTVRNIAVVNVTEDKKISVENKTSYPTVTKKVKETNDSTGVTSDWQDRADYDMGDHVPFQLTATLPDNYTEYGRYKLVFHDTLSKGLTYDAGSMTIKVGENTFVGDGDTPDYTIATSTDESSKVTTLTITFTDLKTSSQKANITNESNIVVEYTATLNTDAVIGSTGNPNTVYLEYSNNPNDRGTGSDGDTPETGTTPTVTVLVFTYQLTVNKTDGSAALPGAGFTLYKYNNSSTADDKYEKVGDEIVGTDDSPITTFEFKGQDAGKYKLVESTVPAGYSKADDLEFEVTASYNSVGNETLTVTPANTLIAYWSTGIISTEVENKKGGTLPSTGGMGTTLFTVCGVILMGGAAILLVTRKRMSK
jgi:fimbrial isopeptide formation D2 family protein/LPXTG-motif cell wall-anchored protein